jgi:3-phosphoshikimate 1-carboxyvinyltransferase
VPGSKSITNRALVLAALADGETTLTGVLESDDTRHMRASLEALGIGIRALDDTTWVVSGGRARPRAPATPLFMGNSGTSVRFLAALATLVPGSVTLVGDEAMARRPIADLVDGLRQLGTESIAPRAARRLRCMAAASRLARRACAGIGRVQYFSALLLAGGLASGPIRVEIDGRLVSRPYVEITRRMVEDLAAGLTSTHPHSCPAGSHLSRPHLRD